MVARTTSYCTPRGSSQDDDVSTFSGDSTSPSILQDSGRHYHHHHYCHNHSFSGGLHGRTKEAALLKEALDRVVVDHDDDDDENDEGPPRCTEVIFISGKSGTGKSTLAERTLMRNPQSTHLFVKAKFDQEQHHQQESNNNVVLFAPIIGALSDVCDLIMEDEDRLVEVRHAILEDLSPGEVQFLVQSIPSLSFLTGVSPNTSYTIQRQEDNAELRFQSLCQSFLRICTSHVPLALFLDDCQWADGPTVRFLQRLTAPTTTTTTTGNNNNNNNNNHHPTPRMLLVCAYRDDDANNHLLPIRQVKFGNDCECKVTEVQIDQLQLPPIVQLVGDFLDAQTATTPSSQPPYTAMLDSNRTRIRKLSEVVHRKTHGNVYHVLRYLESLVDENLLQRNYELDSWSWDIDRIQVETSVSDNVADLVTSKIEQLPGKMQELLQIAACIGMKFQTKHVETIYLRRYLPEASKTEKLLAYNNVKNMIYAAEAEGLVERSSTKNEYKFAHHRVQQFLYNMLGDGKHGMHLEIGKFLKENLSKRGDEEARVSFLVVEQLNLGAKLITDVKALAEVVDYNILCAKLARKKTKFEKAGEYLRAASSMTPRLDDRDVWSTSYKRCLEVFSALAEVEFTMGNIESSKEAIETVLAKATTNSDKQRVILVKVKILGAEGRYHQAIDLSIEAVKLLGSRFPVRPNKLQLLVALIRAMMAMGHTSSDRILSLPLMTDEAKKAEVESLMTLSSYADSAADEKVFGLAVLRILRLTLGFGLTRAGCAALAGYAVILAIAGKRKQAFELGRVVLKLGERDALLGNPHPSSLVYGCVNHLRRPISEAIEALNESYCKGPQGGYVEETLKAGLNSCMCMYACGYPLPEVEEYIRDVCLKLREFRLISTTMTAEPLWQAVLNLMGETDSPLKLSGEALNQDAAMETAQSTGNHLAIYAIKFQLVQLYGYFEASLGGVELLEEMKAQLKSNQTLRSHFSVISLKFFTALLLLDRFRRTNRSRYRLRANKIVRTMKKRVYNGQANHEPLLRILVAEQVSLKQGDLVTLIRTHDEAIACAARFSVPQYEALANEKAGNSLATRDSVTADRYYSRAWELYDTWGAQVLVDQIERKRAQLECNFATVKSNILPFSWVPIPQAT